MARQIERSVLQGLNEAEPSRTLSPESSSRCWLSDRAVAFERGGELDERLPVVTSAWRFCGNVLRRVRAGRPEDGWVFPSGSICRHLNGDGAREQHTKALDDSGVKDFVPYVLRHTALTRLGEKAGGDVFALARIAGHSSITVTQRYVHPQADTINRMFTSRLLVGTKLGTPKKLPARAQGKKRQRNAV